MPNIRDYHEKEHSANKITQLWADSFPWPRLGAPWDQTTAPLPGRCRARERGELPASFFRRN